MTRRRSGTQSIERCIGLLRALASRARFGWRLCDLAQHCGIDKGTARRMLTCLVSERLAERSPTDKRYLPGPLLFELGLALPDHDDFKSAAQPVLRRLAAQTGAVSFLCLRSGDDVVCAARVGEVPDHAFTLNVGSRRPMMGSASGAALLAALPGDERKAVVARNLAALGRQGGSGTTLLARMVERSLAAGQGINESNLVPGWNSYAVALRNPAGEPFAAVMVSAASAWFTPSRLATTTHLLQRAAQELQEIGGEAFGRLRRPEGAAQASRRGAAGTGAEPATHSRDAPTAAPAGKTPRRGRTESSRRDASLPPARRRGPRAATRSPGGTR